MWQIDLWQLRATPQGLLVDCLMQGIDLILALETALLAGDGYYMACNEQGNLLQIQIQDGLVHPQRASNDAAAGDLLAQILDEGHAA